MLHGDNYLHKSFNHVVYKDKYGQRRQPLMPVFSERCFCMAWARRFGFPSTLISSNAPHTSSCAEHAGVNGAHATVCPSQAGERSLRHNRFVRCLAFIARSQGFLVHKTGRAHDCCFEYSFGTDEHGAPTALRSDLVITNASGVRFCLDVTFTDPSAKLNTSATPPSTTPGLKRQYDDHVRTYGALCAHHDMKFVPLAFDTLGRVHKESAKQVKRLLIKGASRGSRPPWSAAKVVRALSDGLHGVSAACVLRACGAPTRDRVRRGRGSAAGA